MNTPEARLLAEAVALGRVRVDHADDPGCDAKAFTDQAVRLSDREWHRFKQHRNSVAIRLAITVGELEPAEADADPEDEIAVNEFRAAAELGRAAALGAPGPVQLIRATASLAARACLAEALRSDPAIRGEFYRAFHQAIEGRRSALDAYARWRDAEACRQAQRVAEAVTQAIPAEWRQQAAQAVHHALGISDAIFHQDTHRI